MALDRRSGTYRRTPHDGGFVIFFGFLGQNFVSSKSWFTFVLEQNAKTMALNYFVRQTNHPEADLHRNWSAPVGGALEGESLGNTPEESFELYLEHHGLDDADEDERQAALKNAPEYRWHDAYQAYAQVHYEGLGGWLLNAEDVQSAMAEASRCSRNLTECSDEGDGFHAERVEAYYHVIDDIYIFAVKA